MARRLSMHFTANNLIVVLCASALLYHAPDRLGA